MSDYRYIGTGTSTVCTPYEVFTSIIVYGYMLYASVMALDTYPKAPFDSAMLFRVVDITLIVFRGTDLYFLTTWLPLYPICHFRAIIL